MSKRQRISIEDVPAYSREAILTAEEVAKALRCSVRTIERANLPTIYVSPNTRRYCWGDVFDALRERVA